MTFPSSHAPTPQILPDLFDPSFDHTQENYVSTTDPRYPGQQLRQATGNEHAALLEDALVQIKRVVVGQDRLVERVLLCLLANGHCLIEGVPGLAKTLTVSTLSHVVGGRFARVQFTPDLVPADLVGTRIWRPSTESFDIEWGPVFANVVLADEINRAPAKVQSALLEPWPSVRSPSAATPARFRRRSSCSRRRTRSSPRASTHSRRPNATAS